MGQQVKSNHRCLEFVEMVLTLHSLDESGLSVIVFYRGTP